MRAYTFREHIHRPPQRVWDVLVDLPLAPRWRPLVKQMETSDGQPVHPGSRVRTTIEYFGRVQSAESETVVFEPPRRWTLHASSARRRRTELLGNLKRLVEAPST